MQKPKSNAFFRMNLALPYTRNDAQLELHVEVNRIAWIILVAKSSLCNKALLCLIYVGVHYLLGESIYVRPTLMKSLPFKDWFYKDYAVKGARDIDYYTQDDVNSGRVFIYSGTVYKFYDSKNKHLKPNADLIHAIGENDEPYLPGFVVDKMHCTEDDYPCHISMVKYKYLKGNDKPKSVQHFLPVLFALQKIHDAGYVHGDI